MHAFRLLGITWRVVLCLIIPILIVGCTTVQNPDGTTSRVLGFDSPEAQAQANESVKKAAGVLPFPFSSITEAVGTFLVAAVGVYAAKKKGEDTGWDAAHAESPVLGGKPKLPPLPAPAPVPPSPLT